MTLDEAIKHCEEKTKELRKQIDTHIVIDAEEIGDCIECANEHEQLAEWLRDYKRLLEERPQGEWEESHIFSCGNILRMGINVIEHKCKNCGRWSIKWVGTIPDNFCSNCGSKIKGGAE